MFKGKLQEDTEAKNQAAKRWVSAVNYWGGLDEWDFLLCREPQSLGKELKKLVAMRTERVRSVAAKDPDGVLFLRLARSPNKPETRNRASRQAIEGSATNSAAIQTAKAIVIRIGLLASPFLWLPSAGWIGCPCALPPSEFLG